MSPLAAAVAQSVRARKLLSPRQPILVAVSGGVDSMVLLYLLLELAPAFQWQLSVAHLNHQLRGRSSDLDAELVRKTAAQFKLPIRVQRADVRTYARRHKLSIEMAARQLRHQFLARTAARLRIRQVALAHHADDQLEIFFLRLLRGSGTEGLSGMRWHNPSPWDPRLRLARPLLEQSKTALLDYAAAQDVPFREDATNRSVDIQRNRIRHELLPLLRRHYQPALNKTVLRAMDLVAAEGDLVGALARRWLAQVARPRNAARANQKRSDGHVPFDQLPLALQRRSLQLQLLDLGVIPEYALIEQLRQLPESPVGWRRPSSQPATTGAVPFSVMRDERGLIRVLTPAAVSFSDEAVEVVLDSSKGKAQFAGVRVWWSKTRFRGSPGSIQGTPGQERLDAELVGSRIMLRHWRRGDRFQPSGMAQAVKLQDLFVNARIPRAQRHQLLVGVNQRDEIFWVENLRIAERFKLTAGTIRCLHWRWQRF